MERRATERDACSARRRSQFHEPCVGNALVVVREYVRMTVQKGLEPLQVKRRRAHGTGRARQGDLTATGEDQPHGELRRRNVVPEFRLDHLEEFRIPRLAALAVAAL